MSRDKRASEKRFIYSDPCESPTRLKPVGAVPDLQGKAARRDVQSVSADNRHNALTLRP